MIEELVAAIDVLADADPHRVCDGESVLELRRQIARLETVVARQTAAFEAGGEWRASGARTAAQWLFAKTGEPLAVIQRSLRVGRGLRSMPLMEAACAAGDATVAHADVLVRAKTPSTEDAYRRDEAMLVDHATGMRFDRFQRAVAYWFQTNGEEEADKRAARQVEGRRFEFPRGFGGCFFPDGMLDPVNGSIVANELHRLEEVLFHADWHEAKDRLGRKPLVGELRRTAAQRRADALVEMAIRSATAPADGRRPEPLFTVFVGYETFAGRLCQLANQTVVPPGQLAGWLDQAWIERVVFDSPSRVIDVGAQRRIFSGATRRAVVLRDGQCSHELCDMPADWCQIDHVHRWADGGPTTVANGRLACGHHNRLWSHQHQARVAGDADDPP